MLGGSGDEGSSTAADQRSLICRAPFVAMEFDPFGDVQACCANALYPLGNVQRSTLEEIWHGPRATALRSALAEGDLSLGCSVCRHRLTYGYGELPLQYYDNFPLPSGDLTWPYSLQFALHNTCNLACEMCGADRSSSIRAQRSHLDPLPHAYGEAFFEQIVPFLEHAGAVDFSGGEPFLVREHGRIWDLLIEMDRRPLCSLTTNGTVWNERTERVLDHLDTHISVSVDGVTPEVFESIRVGARFHEVMANLDRYLAYTRERGTVLTMSWSLVRANWHQLADAARFAEERGIHLKVQTVIEPEFGVQRLPTPELEHVVETYERQSAQLRSELELNWPMWEREVKRLRDELELRRAPSLRARCMEPGSPANVDHVAAMMLAVDGRRIDAASLDRVLQRSIEDLRRGCSTDDVAIVQMDDHGLVRSGGLGPVLAAAHPAVPLGDAGTLPALLRSLETALDGLLWIGEESIEPERLEHTLWIGRPVRDKVGLIIKCITVAGPEGITLLAAGDATLLGGGGEVPVALSVGRGAGPRS